MTHHRACVSWCALAILQRNKLWNKRKSNCSTAFAHHHAEALYSGKKRKLTKSIRHVKRADENVTWKRIWLNKNFSNEDIKCADEQLHFWEFNPRFCIGCYIGCSQFSCATWLIRKKPAKMRHSHSDPITFKQAHLGNGNVGSSNPLQVPTIELSALCSLSSLQLSIVVIYRNEIPIQPVWKPALLFAGNIWPLENRTMALWLRKTAQEWSCLPICVDYLLANV